MQAHLQASPINPGNSIQIESRSGLHRKIFSKSIGYNGNSIQRYSLWSAADEAVKVVARKQRVVARKLEGQTFRIIRITQTCLCSLKIWRSPRFLNNRLTLGVQCQQFRQMHPLQAGGWSWKAVHLGDFGDCNIFIEK